MLSTEQRERFVRNGFVVLRDALDDDLVREGRRAIECDDSMGPGNQNEPTTEPFRTINEGLFEYAAALIGEGNLARPGTPEFGTDDGEETRIGLHFPDEDLPAVEDPQAQRRARRDLGIHVDNQTNGHGGLYGLGAAIYFDDVGPRDAGFTVWPGSHWMTAEHCELFTTDRDPPLKQARIREDSEFDDLSELFERFEPFEVTGEAGTVTLWHGSLIHSAGMQLSPGSLRMAGFSRFYFLPDAVDSIDEAFANPFRYWEGVDDIGPPNGSTG